MALIVTGNYFLYSTYLNLNMDAANLLVHGGSLVLTTGDWCWQFQL
jgi:hypothetical protein